MGLWSLVELDDLGSIPALSNSQIRGGGENLYLVNLKDRLMSVHSDRNMKSHNNLSYNA